MIRSIIIDDEAKSRETLRLLLQRYCPEVMICDEASSVQTGREAILKQNPDVVFLDIEMPDGSGFRLLDSFQVIDFEVVFTTAFDQFAIKAIRHSALDYLLKPISPDELRLAVEKVKDIKEKKLEHRQYRAENSNTQETGKLILSTLEKIHVIDVDNIVRCESDNYYTNLYFKDKTTLMVSKTLKEIESMLINNNFIRPHKSHLVNVKYIMNYSKENATLLLTNGAVIPVSRRKKERIIEIINNL